MRASWLVVVAACGGGAEPAPPPTGTRGAGSAIAVPAAEPPPVPPSTGMHGSAIDVLAITDAGDAAVTADGEGALRLWLTLDGTREPVGVPGAPPHALDLARDGDGFLIANHDEARGLELVRLDARGAVRARVRLAAEPAIEQVELTPSGAVVLRADQAIELLDTSGVQLARLVPEPRTRIAAIVGRAGRVLAILVDGRKVRVRWLELGAATAAWGARSPEIALDLTRPIALSPDHRWLLGARPDALHTPALVDLATGQGTETLVCTTPAELELHRTTVIDVGIPGIDESTPTPLGFVDASTIACTTSGRIVWWKADGTPMPVADEVLHPGVSEPGIGGGRMIGAAGSQLAVFEPAAQHYLGYAFHAISHLRIAPAGVLIRTGDQAPLLLGDDLREKARYALPRGELAWTDLLPIDERYVLRMSSRKQMADPWGTTYAITVFDMERGAVHQELPNLAQEVTLAYEPATRLLATSDGASNLLLRYDPARHAFTERFEVHEPVPLRGVHLLDPALSGGVVALTIEERHDGVTIGELHADDLHGTAIRTRRTYAIPGELRAIDRSGRVYAQGAADPAVVVYTRGTLFARLSGLGGMQLHPSPDATHVAGFRDGKARLVAVDGKVMWDVALWGSAELAWTTTGELIVRYGAALAKLDRATGTLRERQCGWGFGIADQPFADGTDLSMVCDVSP